MGFKLDIQFPLTWMHSCSTVQLNQKNSIANAPHTRNANTMHLCSVITYKVHRSSSAATRAQRRSNQHPAQMEKGRLHKRDSCFLPFVGLFAAVIVGRSSLLLNAAAITCSTTSRLSLLPKSPRTEIRDPVPRDFSGKVLHLPTYKDRRRLPN